MLVVAVGVMSARRGTHVVREERVEAMGVQELPEGMAHLVPPPCPRILLARPMVLQRCLKSSSEVEVAVVGMTTIPPVPLVTAEMELV